VAAGGAGVSVGVAVGDGGRGAEVLIRRIDVAVAEDIASRGVTLEVGVTLACGVEVAGGRGRDSDEPWDSPATVAESNPPRKKRNASRSNLLPALREW
jgi:hypothetical protein